MACQSLNEQTNDLAAYFAVNYGTGIPVPAPVVAAPASEGRYRRPSPGAEKRLFGLPQCR